MLAFIDLRPWVLLGAVPLAALLAVGLAVVARRRWPRVRVAAVAALGTAALLGFLFYGPWVGQTEEQVRRMTWQVERGREGFAQAEVILAFVDEPGRMVGEFSDELAAHLARRGEAEVTVVLEVTRDYGQERGFRLKEVAGLRAWRSEWGYSGWRSPEGRP
ncbi:MAG: hypothetical protein RJA22_517 [Verrucomicrobiota bacterium]|jgi:hypothetical protein